MDTNLQQLKSALQMLALPITAQVHLDKNEVGRVERLRKLFQERHHFIQVEMADQLTPEQKQALAQLDSLLFCLNPGMSWLVWPEERLRRNAAWRKVRTCARKALIQFGWPLELPFDNAFMEKPANQDRYLEDQGSLSGCYA